MIDDRITTSATSNSPASAPSMTSALTTVITQSPTDPTEPSVVTVTIKNTTPIPSNDNVTPKSLSNSKASEIPTASYTSSDVASSTLAVDEEPESRTSGESHRPTIIGASVGVSIGLVAIALLLYVLRRYLKIRESCTATVYFPPDPIDPFATRIFPKVELDALPNVIHELDGTTAPSELENSTSAVAEPKRPPSIVSELEGSPVIPPDPTNRASVATTLNEDRWSNVSSLAPPVVHRSSRARPSIAETLSIVSQQHHGSGQDVFLTPPRPHASHRLSRPTSGLLPDLGVSNDEIPLTPKTSTVTVSKQGNNDVQEPHEGEQGVAVRGTHEGEQVSTSETAQTSSGESAWSGGTTQAGQSFQEGQIADESGASRKSSTEVQTSEFEQAGEITSEVEAAHKSEDLQQSDANQEAEDMQAGEGRIENVTPHQTDEQAQSGK